MLLFSTVSWSSPATVTERSNFQNTRGSYAEEYLGPCKSRHRSCSRRKAVLKNFAIFTGKQLCWGLFLIKFMKKRLQHRCFPVKIALKFLRIPILKNICEWLLSTLFNIYMEHFAKINGGFHLLIIFARKLHHRFLREF